MGINRGGHLRTPTSISRLIVVGKATASICYLGHYVDTRSNVAESLTKNLLTNGTLDRRHARVILLHKKWWSEEVVVL
jgi:hypothetical protein